jgi:hypothetical protein
MEISPSHLTYALLASYCLAGCLMEHLTLFYAWSFASNASDLARMQTSSGTRAGFIYVLPKTIHTVQTVVLALNASTNLIPGIWWSVAFLALNWLSAAFVQVPLQLKLRASKGRDREALERLLSTTRVRTGALVGHCAVSARHKLPFVETLCAGSCIFASGTS